jgi:hypothetical protein
MHMAMAMANGIYCRQAVSASLAGSFSAIDPMEDMGSYRTQLCTTEYRDMASLLRDSILIKYSERQADD